MSQLLPASLPAGPLELLAEWLDAAVSGQVQPNPNAMTLATVDRDGTPSARVVLLKDLVTSPGYAVFYTNYRSRKARAIDAEPRVAGCLHWDTMGRQVRLEGIATVSPESESDAYFASRDPRSQLGAWGSDQSEPVASRDQLLAQTERRARSLGLLGEQGLDTLFEPDAEIATLAGGVPRPPHWGGYRIWLSAVELWCDGPGRIHDRARWTRLLTPVEPGVFRPGAWTANRLQP